MQVCHSTKQAAINLHFQRGRQTFFNSQWMLSTKNPLNLSLKGHFKKVEAQNVHTSPLREANQWKEERGDGTRERAGAAGNGQEQLSLPLVKNRGLFFWFFFVEPLSLFLSGPHL